jgi:hypothetical protein
MKLLDPKNIHVAFRISFLSRLQAEIKVRSVWAAILDFRLPVWLHSIVTTSFELVGPPKHGGSRWNFVSISSASRDPGVVTTAPLRVGVMKCATQQSVEYNATFQETF